LVNERGKPNYSRSWPDGIEEDRGKRKPQRHHRARAWDLGEMVSLGAGVETSTTGHPLAFCRGEAERLGVCPQGRYARDLEVGPVAGADEEHDHGNPLDQYCRTRDKTVERGGALMLGGQRNRHTARVLTKTVKTVFVEDI